jgi:hypothetical protein
MFAYRVNDHIRNHRDQLKPSLIWNIEQRLLPIALAFEQDTHFGDLRPDVTSQPAAARADRSDVTVTRPGGRGRPGAGSSRPEPGRRPSPGSRFLPADAIQERHDQTDGLV